MTDKTFNAVADSINKTDGSGVLHNYEDDPWIHRSDGMKCKTCMWFVAKAKEESSTMVYDLGRCRRHSPTMNGYPVVFVNDWCGDHKLDENKI